MQFKDIINELKPTDEKGWNRLAVSLSMFVLGLTFASWAVRIPDVQHHLGIGDAELGLALFALPLGQFPAMALAPNFVARWGAKRLILLSSVGFSLSLVLVGLTGNIFALIVALFVMGFFNSFLNIANNTQAVVIEKRFGRSIMAKFHGCWSIGGVVGGLIGGILAALTVSSLTHFVLIFLLNIAVMFFGREHLIEDNPQLEATSDKLQAKELRAVNHANTTADRMTVVKRSAQVDTFLILLGVVGFCSMLTEGTMYDWNSVYFVNVLGETGLSARAGYLAAMIAMVMGRFYADDFINRLGEQRVLEGSAVLMIFGLTAIVMVDHVAMAILGSALVGAGMASVVPICYSLAGRTKRVSASAAISLVSAISFWGFVFGPPAIGFVSEATSLGIAFSLVIVAPMVILVLTPALMRLKIKRMAEAEPVLDTPVTVVEVPSSDEGKAETPPEHDAK